MSMPSPQLTPLRRFISDRRGAFAISLAMLGAFLLSMAALGLEGSRYITEQARLSDAMEQAALALTAEDNGEGASRNDVLSMSWLDAYMNHAEKIDKPIIRVLHGSADGVHKLAWVEYRLSSRVQQSSWFASSYFPSFNKQVKVGDNGAARKFRSNIDVAFAVDFSGSMRQSIDKEIGDKSKPWKMDVAKQITVKLARQLAEYNIDNKVAFIPFGWGTRKGNLCTPQFVLNSPLPPDVFGKNSEGNIRELYNYIDYQRTIDAIPNQVNDIRINVANIPELLCLSFHSPESEEEKLTMTQAQTIPLTADPDYLENTIINMSASDRTLVSSGMLEGTQVLAKGTASRKVLVIVSDGQDWPILNEGITEKLLNTGLCEKIRSVLTTPYSVGKIAFIALKYNPTSDWEKCVGANNFYTAQNYQEFEDAMTRAVYEEVGHNTLKDY
ncbi:TadE/TadG family type IV pilus assembly protein [Scandinavium sp.]|uniref:TadE/TadG family type IV pilus assembly protein n=1 Tax=Scandinavium sp. TaxID=2830653 RepID=UPI00289958BE|nr:TadE/TadG family type IV pilus assembly protein [Scandinavium sp.]